MEQIIYRITGGTLSAAFANEKGGVSLYSLRDKKTKKNVLTQSNELFSLKAKNLTNGTETVLSSLKNWKSVCFSESKGKLEISLSDNSEVFGIGVIITITSDENRLMLDTILLNHSTTHTLLECDYPELHFDANRNTSFFYPYGCGEVRPCAMKTDYNNVQSYPSYGASMQYLAMFNNVTKRGIYYGLHDTAPAAKKLCCIKKASQKSFCLKAFEPLSDIKSGSNGQKLCGTLIWQAFDGDWYDAAQLYRNFIETEARYNADFDMNGRKDVPQWLKNVSHWFNMRVDGNKPFADDVIQKAKEIGVTSAIHLYYWHEIPFDNDYPHYFPMKSVVKGELEKLHAAGIKVMPYINGRLWDTHDKGCQDWQFTSVAKPYTTKKFDGEPFVETYASKETDGSKVALAVMCPSTTLWQDKVEEIVLSLYDVGFDAVYIDQIAAAEAKPCCDATHNHPLGGGTWWCQSYNTLLERIHRKMPADRAMTTECTADPFLKYVAGYLSWLWVKNNQVPAFPAIFSDKVITFGTDFRAFGNFGYGAVGQLDDSGSRIFTAQSFIFGQQMGWMMPAVFDAMPHNDFYIKLVREREKLIKFFNAGRLLRPPVVTSNLANNVSHECREAYDKYVEEPAVTSEVWMHNASGEKVLIAVNAALEDAETVVKSELPDGVYTCDGDVKTITVANGEFKAHIPALGYLAVRF